MKYICDNDLHIHTHLSLCSGNPLQTTGRILEYAEDEGLKDICITDHFWHSEEIPGANDWYAQQNYAHITKNLPLPHKDGINFYFGCETELSDELKIGVTEKDLEEMDFIIIPTTHFHIRPFALSEKEVTSAEKRAESWYRRFGAVLDMDLPWGKIGIAHLACTLIADSHGDYIDTLNALDGNEMKRLFSEAARKNAGIELNADDMNYKEEEKDCVLRMFRIAKDCGCKFYMGSDAHSPEALDGAKKLFLRAVDDLNLEENDKFRITF